MIDIKSYKNTENLLKKHGQSHLLGFWSDLDDEQRQNLLEQIRQLDFVKIDKWVANFILNPGSSEVEIEPEPAKSYSPAPVNKEQRQKYAEAVKLGKELISQARVAAFVVAGGQGTRLGFKGPKGNFPISPLKKKTLFQIFAETIAAVSARYKAVCPWYIMTSPANHDDTVQIFQTNDYYGLGEGNVFIFQQGTLPSFDTNGKILLENKGKIACSPDGHGGSLKALYTSGAIEDMKKRGVEYISYWQVDNPLINIFDPLFIGLHALDRAEMSSKALEKTGPFESVGNFCLLDGKLTVVEYTEFNKLPDNKAHLNCRGERPKLAERRNPDGSLAFLGSIGIHIINRSFVEKLNAGEFALPLHKAKKDIKHIDEQGNPTESKGIKLESFVFDALPLTSSSIILQTLRSEEFAPTKNATGVDSAESSRQMMIDRAAAWLEYAGVNVPKKPDGSPDCLLEIAPGFAIEKEDIKSKLGRIKPITPKDELYLE